MSSSLKAKLKRLGVGRKKTKKLRAAPPPAQVAGPTVPLESLLPGGQTVETAHGAYFQIDQVYPLTYRHGRDRLSTLQTHPTRIAAEICADGRLAALSHSDFLFVDTETTGLGGAGALAFMVGVAYFERDALVVRQYFLRDHADETAMLHALGELVAARNGLISFNGRSFDIPLLRDRYLLNRLRPLGEKIEAYPHFDLMWPARRIWQPRCGRYALGVLEKQVLDVRRTQQDVPGALIPAIYRDYLHSGDARPLQRVFYHNQIDMLSMVTLAARIMRQFDQPQSGDHPLDLVGVAKWRGKQQEWTAAEKALRLALDADPDEPAVLMELAAVLKKQDRRAEAVPFWKRLVDITADPVDACTELAKFYEWHEIDLPTAEQWTRRAHDWLQSHAAYDQVRVDAVQHRLNRLQQKQ